jgi:hypothetical protein
MNSRMKHLLPIFALLLATQIAKGQVPRDLSLKVSDETGRLLSGAEAVIGFQTIRGVEEHKGLTNDAGEFAAREEMSLGTFVLVNKAGHYGANIIDLAKYKIPTGKVTLPLVLPHVIKPIPLHAVRVSSIKLPLQGEWLGYDLQVADYVPPHGKGKTADLRFKYSKEFTGWKYSDAEMIESRRINKDQSEEQIRAYYGKWRGVLEVSFPGEKEGVITETERYWFYGQLRLPHLAPEKGYVTGLRYEANTYEPRSEPKQVGFYLRTRVKLDADGKIISANYAKIYDDIRFDARGTVSFWYYYNPTPNDRNLEFDPTRNLFPESMKGTNVANP